MEYIDISVVKQVSKKHDKHFFDDSTMRFFNSRISQDAIKSGNMAYFVSSEKFDSKTPRLYSVRAINLDTGKIETIPDFQHFKSNQQAWKFIKNIA